MTQSERRTYLIKYLLSEQAEYSGIEVPKAERGQKYLLRSLFNVRMPSPASDEFLEVQDAYLKAETAEKGVTDISDLHPIRSGIYLWQGDITTLCCDAVVNAANSQLLGCFHPNHGCIDNAIHTYAGIQLRCECSELMKKQGFAEPVGGAKLTKAYNLPCRYVLHTVGPFIDGGVTENDSEKLRGCYISCLSLAEENSIKSIAFPCISTGEFHFPNEKAAKIAVDTVREYTAGTESEIQAIFNVFKDRDYEIYKKLLG